MTAPSVQSGWGCLMYHDITARAAHDYFGVPEDRFARHLQEIAGLPVSGTTLEEAGPGAVAITFDDGYRSCYTRAVPHLNLRGMKATFFITTRWVGQARYLSWRQLREMADMGMSIQSHTASHPFLAELSRDEVRRELQESKEQIEFHLGQPCTSVALPGGSAPRGWTLSDFAELGYQRVATSRWGPNLALPEHAMVRRYTVRWATPDARVREFALARSSSLDPEALRLLALSAVRTALGPSRYARLRHAALGLQRAQ